MELFKSCQVSGATEAILQFQPDNRNGPLRESRGDFDKPVTREKSSSVWNYIATVCLTQRNTEIGLAPALAGGGYVHISIFTGIRILITHVRFHVPYNIGHHQVKPSCPRKIRRDVCPPRCLK